MKAKNFLLLIVGLLIAIGSCKKEDKTQQLILSLRPDGSAGQDALFSKIVPDNNYDTLEDIHLYAWTQGGILNYNRVAINFDMSSIPDGAKIDSAFLSLYFNNTSAYGTQHIGENAFFIQRITSTWDAGSVTWNTQPTSTSQNQVSVPKSTSPTKDYINMNVTKLVQDMINDRTNCFGFSLKLQVEKPQKILLLASSNHQDESLRPKFVVYYTVKL